MIRRAFTLVELMVVIAVIGLLGTVLVPTVTKVVDDARVAKILSTVNALETGADAYYTDTGLYAIEYGSNNPAYAVPNYHRLALNYTAITTWNGPYIKKPLSPADNPFRTAVYMYQILDSGGGCTTGGGFDLSGDGTIDRSGTGNYVCFTGVPAAISSKVEKKYDEGVPGTAANNGKVKTSGTYLMIYLNGGA